jgi:hypothetical protein
MLGGVLEGGQGSSLLNLMSDSFSSSMDLFADGVQKEGLMALHCEWRSFPLHGVRPTDTIQFLTSMLEK